MTHPRNKLHRETIRQLKGRRRIAQRFSNLPPSDPDLVRLACRYGDTGRPCSCWMCKAPRYQRQLVSAAYKFDLP